MKLDSTNPPIYLPQPDQKTVLRLGFENCDMDKWIHAADDLAVFRRHKRALEKSREVCCFAETASSMKTQHEFHDFLLEHLLQNSGLGYRKIGNRLTHEQENLSWDLGERNLWRASTWVAEDICLLEERDNIYSMTAASVCSPSNWHLESKIGQSIDFIHRPVPGYESALSARVNRFLQGLRSGRVMLRYNWSIQAGNELCWRDENTAAVQATDAPSTQPYWRIERQTFVRLPESGAIVFGIRIFLHGFDSLRPIAGFSEAIEQLTSQLPEAEKRYKGLA